MDLTLVFLRSYVLTPQVRVITFLSLQTDNSSLSYVLRSVFLFGEFLHHGDKNKLIATCRRALSGKKKCKSFHILREKSHMSPSLVNEFLLVTRTRQDSKKILLYCLTSSQIRLIPFVDDCQSTCLTKLKKEPLVLYTT
jgi:hypothetical protein